MAERSPFELRTWRASDGYRWYLRFYPASGRPCGQIVFLHGIRSHGGWYTRSCETLAGLGYEVHFLDRRGAGLNTAHRGDMSGFRRLIDDVAEYLTHLRLSRPWLPITLAGISWGGKLAAALPYRAPGLCHQMALICPGLCPIVRPPFLARLRILAARGLNPKRMFPIPLNEPDYFTDDPKWQAFIEADRFGLLSATARFLFASVGLDVYLRRAKRAIDVPTLLMLAGHDRVIDNAQTRQWFLGTNSHSRTVLDYPEAHHTLEFESADHPFVKHLAEWIDRSTVRRR